MTIWQRIVVFHLVKRLSTSRGIKKALHGDCGGADEEFDAICMHFGVPRGIMPCDIPNTRTHCENQGAEVLAPERRPLVRNQDIVYRCDQLFGTPRNYEFGPRGSGTWTTIKYGTAARKPTYIIFPNGTVEWRNT